MVLFDACCFGTAVLKFMSTQSYTTQLDITRLYKDLNGYRGKAKRHVVKGNTRMGYRLDKRQYDLCVLGLTSLELRGNRYK